MSKLRSHFLALMIAVATVAGCGRAEHAGLPPDVRRELASGREVLDGWIAQSRNGAVLDDRAVIGLGYAERLRLGLGSPFRLVEMSLRDPRLDADTRRSVAWALLARTLAGEAYEIDPVSLDRAGAGGMASWPGFGRHHLVLIENAITGARDPRSGEMAVRLAYGIAALEGSLSSRAPTLATRAASLIRDREIARRDVATLLRSAEAVQGDPLGAVSRWRSERFLRVEAPSLTDLPAAAEREALDQALLLAPALRSLAARLGDDHGRMPSEPDVLPSLLTASVAARLAMIADSLDAPPQAPVAIAARTYRQELMQQPWLTEEEHARRQRFTTIADEERFAAAYAQLVRRSPHDAAPSLAAMWAAVALRAYAQEPVWFPGMDAPSARQLEERFGLSSIEYEADMPAAWRPFYRRMLELALQDMQRVLPALDVRGMAVRFGASPRGEATLAMHDPRTRRLLLPPGSAAGTIAHEVAHDLDWQVALRRYRVRGDYGSDRAARANDNLAFRMRGLVQHAAMDADLTEREHSHATRPAENFARAVDWFVTASLASQGRSNGYLTSIQDEVITGYGTVRSPDISGRAGDAIINILDEVAPLYPETRDWFLGEYGSGRAHTPLDLVRAIRDADIIPAELAAIGLPQEPAGPTSHELVVEAFDGLDDVRARGFHAIDAWTCRAPGGAVDNGLEHARRRLVMETTAARARGIALRQARRIAGEAGVRWVARKLHGGPWPAQDLDIGMESMLTELVEKTRAAGSGPEIRPRGMSFELLATPGYCGAGVAPFTGATRD